MTPSQDSSRHGRSDHTPSTFGLRTAYRDQIEPVRTGLERTHDLGRDADRVRLADLAHFVIEARAPRNRPPRHSPGTRRHR
jgi:hypothetical protein